MAPIQGAWVAKLPIVPGDSRRAVMFHPVGVKEQDVDQYIKYYQHKMEANLFFKRLFIQHPYFLTSVIFNV